MRSVETYTKTYLADDFETKYQVLYRRKKVLEILGQYPHKRILEIGCGMEPLAGWVNDFDEYVIVEPSEKFAEHAKSVLDVSKNIEVIQDFFEVCLDRLSAKNFDFIVVSGLLHEVEQPDVFLRGLSRVAQKETVLHINVPNARSFHRVLAVESGLAEDIHEFSQQNINFQQHAVFDMESLRSLIQDTMKEQGFRVDFFDTGGGYQHQALYTSSDGALPEAWYFRRTGFGRSAAYGQASPGTGIGNLCEFSDRKSIGRMKRV